MPVDPSLVGRTYPPTAAYAVTDDAVRAFAEATGGRWQAGVDPVPATFPIVLAFEAMNAFLAAEELDLSRIVHGEQRFSYTRPLEPGDELVASLAVAGLRQIGGNDIISTTSEVTDASGALVCSTSATLVHRGAEA